MKHTIDYKGFYLAFRDISRLVHSSTSVQEVIDLAVWKTNELLDAKGTLLRIQPKIRLLHELLGEVAAMDEVVEVRGRGLMVGIDLGEHDPQLRLGHRVTLEARKRGAIVRPLGDTVVLMPPLAITKGDLTRLVAITADSIKAAIAELYPLGAPTSLAERRLADADSADRAAA